VAHASLLHQQIQPAVFVNSISYAAERIRLGLLLVLEPKPIIEVVDHFLTRRTLRRHRYGARRLSEFDLEDLGTSWSRD
jgi:hypothetical protein